MTYPSFNPGDVLFASDQNAVGLWLVKTQTVGTGVSSVTVTGAFSSDYTNYRIIYTNGDMSASTVMKMQLGATTTGYYGCYIYGQSTGSAVAGANDNNTSSFTYAGGNSDVVTTHLICDVMNPFIAEQTAISAQMVHYSTFFGTYTGVIANTTSYTAFTLIPFSGTMTGGTIRVYGYRN